MRSVNFLRFRGNNGDTFHDLQNGMAKTVKEQNLASEKATIIFIEKKCESKILYLLNYFYKAYFPTMNTSIQNKQHSTKKVYAVVLLTCVS